MASTRPTAAPSPTVRRADWLQAGVDVLRAEGDRGLTVDALCARLGKTKGSFYHHFAGREGFVRALLEHWEDTFTLQIIDDLEPVTGPLRRLQALSERTARDVDLPLERAIRIWSDREPAAAEVLSRVDARREAFLLQLFEAAFDDRGTARFAARAHMAVLVGVEMLYQDLERDELQALSRFVDTLGFVPTAPNLNDPDRPALETP